MQIVSNIALISINETLVVQLVSFLIFLWIINRLMIRPLLNVMKEREDYIARIQKEATSAEAEIEQLARQVRKQENAAIRSANSLRAKLEEAARGEADEIVHEARTEVEALSRENRKEIQGLVAEARKSVETEARTIAVGMMEKLLNRSLQS